MDKSEDTTLAVTSVERRPMCDTDLFGGDDEVMGISIVLPMACDVTDPKVEAAMRTVFPGCAKGGTIIRDREALAKLAASTLGDISRLMNSNAAEFLSRRAAATARYWDLCNTIRLSIGSGGVDDSAVQAVATAIGRSSACVRQMMTLPEAMTMSQAYLLGSRGVGTPTLHRLAAMRDRDAMCQVIDGFLELCRDTNDKHALIDSRKRLEEAIKLSEAQTYASDGLELDSSDPTHVDNSGMVTPEYANASEALSKAESMLGRLANDKQISKLLAAFDSFFVMDDRPDAAMRVDLIVSRAEEVLDRLAKATENLTALRDSLTSLTHSEPVPPQRDGDGE